jgi:hypothetical protein
MKFVSLPGALPLALAAVVAVVTGGCGQAENQGDQGKGQLSSRNVKATHDADGKKDDTKGHDHGGWWCAEHGVPEAECLMCLKTEAELKKKGDWCAQHERARSQCFLCDPKLKEKYAAIYRDKEGKEPPPTEDEEKTRKAEKP